MNGLLDLSQHDLSEPVPLAGTWRFRSLSEEGKPWQSISVPSAWNEITGTAYSSGEYQLSIILPQGRGEPIALQIPQLVEMTKIYVNGTLLFSSGDWETGDPGYSLKILHLPSHHGVLEIRVCLKNTFFRNGGLYRNIILGYEAVLQQSHIQDVVGESMVLGALLIVALFNLFLFLNKFPENYSIFLGLSALFYSIRGMLIEPLCFPAFLGSADLSFFYRLEYLVSYLGLAAIMPFLANVAPWNSSFTRVVYKALLGLYLLAAGVSLLIPLHYVSLSVYLFQVSGLFCMTFGLWVTFPGRVERDKASLLVFLGAVTFLVLVSLDIVALDLLILPFRNITQFGMLLFFLPLAFALSIRISCAYNKAELLSRELEKEVASQTRELRESNEKLKALSTTDPLTGIRNRRSFFEQAELKSISSRQQGNPLSLLVLDLDHFKSINDNYGHKSGDEALCFFTNLCNSIIRETDIFGRVGGEEFAILLSHVDLKGGREIAERIRSEIETRSSVSESPVPSLTVSIGLVCFEKDETVEQVMERADALLYRAKERGRNQVQSQDSSKRKTSC